jgi:hypothetical protein
VANGFRPNLRGEGSQVFAAQNPKLFFRRCSSHVPELTQNKTILRRLTATKKNARYLEAEVPGDKKRVDELMHRAKVNTPEGIPFLSNSYAIKSEMTSPSRTIEIGRPIDVSYSLR